MILSHRRWSSHRYWLTLHTLKNLDKPMAGDIPDFGEANLIWRYKMSLVPLHVIRELVFIPAHKHDIKSVFQSSPWCGFCMIIVGL